MSKAIIKRNKDTTEIIIDDNKIVLNKETDYWSINPTVNKYGISINIQVDEVEMQSDV